MWYDPDALIPLLQRDGLSLREISDLTGHCPESLRKAYRRWGVRHTPAQRAAIKQRAAALGRKPKPKGRGRLIAEATTDLKITNSERAARRAMERFSAALLERQVAAGVWWSTR